MHILMHNNVDNYPSAWGKFDSDPTKEELVKVLKDYYDDQKASDIADELIANDYCDVDDGSCTSFELQHI